MELAQPGPGQSSIHVHETIQPRVPPELQNMHIAGNKSTLPVSGKYQDDLHHARTVLDAFTQQYPNLMSILKRPEGKHIMDMWYGYESSTFLG